MWYMYAWGFASEVKKYTATVVKKRKAFNLVWNEGDLELSEDNIRLVVLRKKVYTC
jgi:hypothetical protein